MADAMTEISLDTLTQAIISDIQAQFSQLQTVEFYSEVRSGMVLPACLLELTEFQDFDDPDPGTDQLSVMARFEARFIIDGIEAHQAKLDIRALSAAFSSWLRLRRWSNPALDGKKLPTGPAQFLGAFPDEFNPGLDKYEVWRVEWQQVLHLGESVWMPEGITPTIIQVSFSPEIGHGSEEDYRPVSP